MGFFNLLKRLPLGCLQWSFRIPYLVMTFVVKTFRGSGRLAQRVLGAVLIGIVSESERILILGAYNSGKSALLYRIKLGEFIQTVSTSSYIEEESILCNMCLKPAELCIHYEVNQLDALRISLCECGINDDNDIVENQLRFSSRVLFVLDSADTASSGSALQNIASVITQHNFFHQSPKYVIFNNKTDVVGSSRMCLINQLHQPGHLQNRAIWVNGSALTGEGVINALRFLLLEEQYIVRNVTQQEVNDLIQLN